jgi:hypothetical protein
MKTSINKLVYLSLLFLIAYAGNKTFSQVSELIIDVSKPGPLVADICRGQQIEEFNHQFERGLYAQLINNPSFEEIDTKLKSTPEAFWSVVKKGSSEGFIHPCTLKETAMLNEHQHHCIRLEVTSLASGSVGLANKGYWGIKIRKQNKTKYKLSFWSRASSGFKGTIKAKLEGNDGTIYAQSDDFKPTTEPSIIT